MTDNDKTCQTCHKIFTTRANLKIHMTRKRPCVAIDDILTLDKKFKCNRCDTMFQTNQALMRHLNRKFPCELKNPTPEEIELRKLFEQLKEENEQHKSQIEQLQHQSITTNNNNMNSMKNSNINSHNTTNITINSYGKEDMSHITNDMYKTCFRLLNKSVEQLFSMKHFCTLMQQNHNLYISNMRDAYMMIKKASGRWDKVNKSVTLEKMYYDLKNDLSAALDHMRDEDLIEAKLEKIYAPFVDDHIDDDKDERFRKQSCDVMACMAYNNRHFPMEIKKQIDKDNKNKLR